MVAPTLLNSLLTEQQSSTLERRAQPDREAVAKVVTAFLNTQGGILIVGVTETGELRGVEAAHQHRTELEAFVRERVGPQATVRLEVMTAQDREAILIEVPPGAQKPYVFDGAIYVRRGTQTLLASASEVDRLIDRRVREDERWEREVAIGVEPDSLDSAELDKTVLSAVQKYRLVVEPDASALQKLERLELATESWLRHAALVLFANSAGRWKGRYPQLSARATVFTDDQRLTTQDDQMWHGNAFDLFQKLFAFVGQHTPVRSHLEQANPVRQDEPMLPALVVREALLNALAHREYRDTAPIQLRLFPDRLEVWNPGSISEELIAHPGASRPRNPDVARVLYLRGYVEMLGVGMLRMQAEMQTHGLPAPRWENRSGGTLLTLTRNTNPTEQPQRDAEQRVLSERAYRYLQEANAGERITRAEYQARYAAQVAERSARNDLKRLVEFGYVRPVGAAASTAYIRTSKPVL